MERPMSAIGGGSIGVLNLAGSIAGSQRNNATADQARSEAAEKSFQADVARMAAKAHGDVSDPDFSSDRDADGRMPYHETQRQGESSADEVAVPVTCGRSIDLDGALGNAIDLQA
jgi:hypothetical protein